MVVGETQTLFDLLLELREDAVDDVVFVAEMVVQIAWTDFHLLGDRRRRDVRLADIVEQLQRQFENPFAGAAGRFGFHVVRTWLCRAGRAAACRCCVFHPDAVGIGALPNLALRGRSPEGPGKPGAARRFLVRLSDDYKPIVLIPSGSSGFSCLGRFARHATARESAPTHATRRHSTAPSHVRRAVRRSAPTSARTRRARP